MSNVFIKKTENNLVQFFRYGIVSGLALVVDFGGMILLKEVFGLHYLWAATASFLAGLTVNYLLSLAWVFSRSKYSRVKESIIFACIGVAGLGINDVIIWLFTEKLGIFYIVSKLVATGVTFVWNFGVRKVVLFK